MKTKKKVKAKGKAKTILTPKFRTSHQKSKGKPILPQPDFYKVELEMASKAKDGTTQYTYSDHPSRVDLTEEQANSLADDLKTIGCGGRIIHLDGTPEGKVVLTWGSVERTAAAEKLERASLEKTTGHN